VGVTLDTGFLVALERSKQRAIDLAALASSRGIRITLPVAVLAEWWRGGRRQARYMKGFDVESMTERLAKTAGKALAAVPGSTVVDAIVMASAAQRDDVVYTSDIDDFAKLRDQHLRVDHGHRRPTASFPQAVLAAFASSACSTPYTDVSGFNAPGSGANRALTCTAIPGRPRDEHR
jgi:hypothetical protein